MQLWIYYLNPNLKWDYLYKFNSNTKYIVHKSILLRTFLFYKKPAISIVRLSFKINYERLLSYLHLYERFW